MENKGKNENAPGQNNNFIIYIDSREKVWSKKNITFEEVIILKNGSISSDPNMSYSITFKKGDNEKPEGIMVAGDEIKVKNEMKFNVSETNRS